MVECVGLENRSPFTRTGGSNPSASASQIKPAERSSAGFLHSGLSKTAGFRKGSGEKDSSDRSGLYLACTRSPIGDHEALRAEYSLSLRKPDKARRTQFCGLFAFGPLILRRLALQGEFNQNRLVQSGFSLHLKRFRLTLSTH